MGAILAAIAPRVVCPTAQRVLARRPELAERLAGNPHLSDEAFALVYPNAKVPVAIAKELVTRSVLSDGQFAHVLAVEKRSSVLAALVERVPVTPERLDALLVASAFTTAVADRIVAMYSERLSLEWLASAADRVEGMARLAQWWRDPSSATDDHIGEKLRTYPQWAGKVTGETGHFVTWLLATRPGAIHGAARSEEPRVRTWAAGCRHLTAVDDQLAVADLIGIDPDVRQPTAWVDEHAWTLMALVNNPVVGNDIVHLGAKVLAAASEPNHRFDPQRRLGAHPVPIATAYEAIDDTVLLSWALNRSLPNARYNNAGRPWDLPALLSNPNLTTRDLLYVWQRLAPDGGWGSEPLAEPAVADAFNTALSRFPSLEADYGVRPLTGIHPTWVEYPEREQPVPLEDSFIDVGGAKPARFVEYSPDDALRYLERELADDEEAWLFALGMLESGFTGTTSDLVVVTRASCA